MTSIASPASNREWVALLDCGTRLTYEYQSFAPAVDELVPCRRHGYCHVRQVAPERRGQPASTPRRARPRTQHELVEYVRRSPGRTLTSLRQHRFSLRMVHVAARSGDVIIDERSGDIVVSARP